MSKVVLKNATLLLYKGNTYVFEVHSVFCVNGFVKGFDLCVDDYYEIDYSGKILLPMLLNLHSHLGECMYADISGNDWTISKYLEYTNNCLKGKAESQIQLEWQESGKQAIKLMSESGTIGYMSARANMIKGKNLKFVMAGYPFMKSEKLANYSNEAVQKFEDIKNEFQSKFHKVGIFFHSLYLNDKANLLSVKRCMASGADFFTVHLSEDEQTRKMEIDAFDDFPVNTLEKMGLLSEKSILVHCGCLTTQEFDLIKKRKSLIAVCPISNAFLNTKTVDVAMLQKNGISWCLASDGLATGRTFSLFEQGEFLKQNQAEISYIDLFKAVTITPAKYLSTKYYSGKIEAGKSADFIVCKCDKKIETDTFLEMLFKGKIDFEILNLDNF